MKGGEGSGKRVRGGNHGIRGKGTERAVGEMQVETEKQQKNGER